MYDSFGTAASRKDEITQIVLGGERGGDKMTALVGRGCLLGQAVESEKDEGGVKVNMRGRNHADEG